MNWLKQYEKFNHKYFKDQLPKVPVITMNTHAMRLIYNDEQVCYGYTISDADEAYVVLNEDFAKDMKDTLLHEMIHVWQWWNGKPINHGKSFKKWQKKIGRKV